MHPPPRGREMGVGERGNTRAKSTAACLHVKGNFYHPKLSQEMILAQRRGHIFDAEFYALQFNSRQNFLYLQPLRRYGLVSRNFERLKKIDTSKIAPIVAVPLNQRYAPGAKSYALKFCSIKFSLSPTVKEVRPRLFKLFTPPKKKHS